MPPSGPPTRLDFDAQHWTEADKALEDKMGFPPSDRLRRMIADVGWLHKSELMWAAIEVTKAAKAKRVHPQPLAEQ
jgi:hypothetical protein